MTVPRYLRAVERVWRANGGGIAEASLTDIQQTRGPLVPDVRFGGAVVRRIEGAVRGRVHPGVDITTGTVAGVVGDLAVRIHTPRSVVGATRVPLVVHFHGGGHTTGAPIQHDWLCSTVAGDVGAVVVSVDYRKAPEDPAPAAYDDAVAAYRAIVAAPELFGATGPFAVYGDSAGGNLSALVAIAARDEGLDLAAQVLIYPAVDFTRSFPSHERLRDATFLNRDDIDAFRGHYLCGGIDPADVRVSPWFVEDLAGVASALVITAEDDPLVDEGEAYAARLEAAGVAVRQTRYVNVPHGFIQLPGLIPVARQTASEIVTFLRAKLEVDAAR